MSTQVTLTIADETYRRAENLARLTGRNVADVLADTLSISFQPLGTDLITSKPLLAMSDTEVLAASDAQMEATHDQRISGLLDKQQAGILINAEYSELLALMQIYQAGLLYKAQALHEAVRRGLRPQLEP